MGRVSVDVQVPGGATFLGAVRVPGGGMVTGVVASETRTNGNLPMHIWEKVAMVLRSSTEVVCIEVCGHCPTGL